jgi:cardiolipin synthase
MHWNFFYLTPLYVTLGWLIRVGMVPVILRRQLAPGASLAWLGIIFLHPYIGVALYLLVGETRLGPHRVERHRELVARYRSEFNTPDEAAGDAAAVGLEPSYDPMVLQAQKISSLPVVGGSGVEFLCDTPTLVDRLVAEIDGAKTHAHLLYYIFAPDATGMRVATALENAAGRGVECRVLVDAVAGRRFFHRRVGLSRRLVAAGVQVAAALPADPVQRRLPRMDLRNHRKLAIIDGRVAFAGSHNLIDADYGGRHGGPWYDVTGRFAGPVVSEFAAIFAEDWAFETGHLLPVCNARDVAPIPGGTPMQVVPTGPSAPGESFRRVFLAAVQSARSRLILTTPYFVPDEPTLVALMMAADRGVDVKLLLPNVPDHFFTAAAGRAHFTKLLQAGVAIHLYRPGLIHAKTTTVDDAFALFGSANLDVRSFNLNFELSALLYGPEVTQRLRAVQTAYLADSCKLDAEEWAKRSTVKRYADSAISLLSPLL